jgi:hypothetical protein
MKWNQQNIDRSDTLCREAYHLLCLGNVERAAELAEEAKELVQSSGNTPNYQYSS